LVTAVINEWQDHLCNFTTPVYSTCVPDTRLGHLPRKQFDMRSTLTQISCLITVAAKWRSLGATDYKIERQELESSPDIQDATRRYQRKAGL